MTYWGVNAFFLAAVAIPGIIALAVHARRARAALTETTQTQTTPTTARRAKTLGTVIAVAVLLVMTAVFDNVMIGIGLVGYDREKISGVFIGIAPVEDFSYAVAALALLPSLWVLMGAGSRTPRHPKAPSA
ncbi:lycopene cyclase domain-containing protein [Frondihabitans australicus]|uniref:Lycopene cyclase domain-containing protein n=1 Tax=Frondihabitans australicus TaxID=386892 RepID=A0A495ILF2_9MICO|nr:lycopene cyclase domain-containing protein [Frondihabitans australicus]RKR76101.1 lycopene cyclase domain-containing protein [Frondihabitans australicus]